MAHLINPSGRIVAVDDPARYQELLTKGFTVPTPEQVDNHIKSRMALVSQMQNPPHEGPLPVYLATVTQGGKDGYGTASGCLIDELRQLDVNITTEQNNQRVAMLFHNPYSILRLENPYRLIYTMFESTKIPDDWKTYLEAADKVLVPSKWCQKVFKESGIDTEVVPLGYNHHVFNYKEKEVKRKKRKDFVFLHYNAFNIRKGFLEVLKAFNKAFTKDEPVKMIFKTTLYNIPLPLNKTEYPNIEIINGQMPQQELAELIHNSDCFVFPSRGEGFGMTPLEAMACGLPAIIPNAHGITEYFNSDCMYEVKIGEMCPAIYSRYKSGVGEMFVSDVDDLARQMRYIYEHQEEAIEKGKQASEWVKQWTYEETAKKLKALLEPIYSQPIPERPLRNVLQLKKV